MKNKKILTCLAMVGLGLHASAAILTSDNFETDLGNWSVAEGNAGHYLYDDTSTDPNYATTGDGAAFVQATWGEGVLGLTNSLALDTNEATSVTISLDYIWDSTSSTRFVYIDYSTDGGTNWTDSIGSNGGWGTFSASTASGSFTKTLDESTVGSFTDLFKFRLRGKDGNSPFTAYLDNIEIEGANAVPEPSAFALLAGCFSLTWIMLRRRS